MTGAIPRVHAVTDTAIAALPDVEKIAAAMAFSADVCLHARLPHGDGARLIELAMRLRRATGQAPFVNDRLDVARMVYASGVHLPADGLPTRSVKELLGPNLALGRSTHGPDEARRAIDDGADYVFLGPIWETPSHAGQAPLGPAVLRGLPFKVVAIGGVTAERAAVCREEGAWGVAAISALWRAPDPAAAVRRMLLSFGLPDGAARRTTRDER